MFCANHDITTQEYMIKAAILYFKTYLNEVDKQYMTCSADVDTDPSAPFDYPLQWNRNRCNKKAISVSIVSKCYEHDLL